MEEVKKGPGRPPTTQEPRKVRYVQTHDAFTPLQMAPIMSLSVEGAKAMKSLMEGRVGIEVEHDKGRKFVIPYGNISFYELA